MTTSSNAGTPDTGRPGPRTCEARDQYPNWPRRGPLAPEVRDHLASGFGARVRALRAERGLSMRALGELLSCDRRTIERLELGRHRPTRAQVAWLARALSEEGQPSQVLDYELLNLVDGNVRGQRKTRRRRRGERNGLYTLPSELTAQRQALLKGAERDLQRVKRIVAARRGRA